MKLVDVKPSTYTDFNKENNEEDPEFKFGDHVSILYYKNIFVKGYVPNWSEEVFVIKKRLKILLCGHILLIMLIVKKFLERFTKKNFAETK